MRLLGLLIAAVAAKSLYHARGRTAWHGRLYLDAARDLAVAAARAREAKGA